MSKLPDVLELTEVRKRWMEDPTFLAKYCKVTKVSPKTISSLFSRTGLTELYPCPYRGPKKRAATVVAEARRKVLAELIEEFPWHSDRQYAEIMKAKGFKYSTVTAKNDRRALGHPRREGRLRTEIRELLDLCPTLTDTDIVNGLDDWTCTWVTKRKFIAEVRRERR